MDTARGATATVPVLLYHSVAREPVPGFEPWEVRPEVFAAQMAQLADCGYRPVPLARYAGWLREPAAHPLPDRACVITFDDGLASFELALAVLARHGFPCTMFVPTAYVGGTSSWLAGPQSSRQAMMTWSQLRSARDTGVEIGSHAHVHRPLDERSAARVRQDLTTSKRILEDGLGEPVRSFAYPHGHNSRRVRAEVEAASYSCACAVADTLSAASDDPFAIPRVFATTSADPAAFARLLERGNRPRRPRELLRTKAWRAARRLRSAVR